jgi:hypothetical protein
MKIFFSRYVAPTFGYSFAVAFGLACGTLVGLVSGGVLLYATLVYG